jgi:hypothetical protein
MKAYRGWAPGTLAATPLLMSRLTEHINDAFTLVHHMSRARNLQDVLRLQAGFVQKKIDMFAGGATALTEVAANAGTIVGSFAALSQWETLVENIARNSPRYEAGPRQADGDRTWRAPTEPKADDRRT